MTARSSTCFPKQRFTSAAIWLPVEEGKLSFMDRISDHLPKFSARGKAEITLHQVLSIPEVVHENHDHELRRGISGSAMEKATCSST
jgi:Beta-lactamase